MEIKYNNYSERLREEINKAKPKKGEIIWFESLDPKLRGSRVRDTDRIFDPWGGKDGNGEYIDIAHVVGMNDKGAIIEPIQFTVQDHGAKGCRGGDRKGDLLFEYLFLTNQNRTNKEKPWHVPGRNFVFYQREPNKAIEKDQNFRFWRRNAEELIDVLEGDRLKEYADWLNISYNVYTQDGDIKKQLYKIADREPQLITRMDKDLQFIIKSAVMRAERHGILNWDSALNRLMWTASKTEVVSIPAGTNKYEQLIKYFMGDGYKAFELIKSYLKQHEEKKKLDNAVKNMDPVLAPIEKEPEPELAESVENTVTLQEKGKKGKK